MKPHRRELAFGLPLAVFSFALVPTFARTTEPLPRAEAKGGMPLMEALARRRSQRSFSDTPLPPEQLSRLLWAAFGLNRLEQGERTAPSWRGSKEIEIYIATAQGVTRYEPVSHSLLQHTLADIRAQCGRQEFPAAAPAVLIYVADMVRMAKASPDEQKLYAHVDAAVIAQNVYLFAASEGLATVLLGNVDKEALAKALDLTTTQIVTFTQPIGAPGDA